MCAADWLAASARIGHSACVAGSESGALPDDLQRLRDELRDKLAPDGWRIEVALALRDGYAEVVATHPLVPGEHACASSVSGLPDQSRAWLRRWREVRLVHGAPVRPEAHALLRGLRGAADVPNGDGAPPTVRSVGYVLMEQGILTEDEARWLDEAVEPDPETDPRARRP
jgi:hypothetical protein